LAREEPQGFRDIPWGAPKTTVQAKLNERCTTLCETRLVFAGVRARTTIEFGPDGGMEYVTMRFSSRDFLRMKETFIARYGEPTFRRTSTRTDAEVENEELEWRGETVLTTLEKYGPITLSQDTDSLARIQTMESYRRRVEDFREKVKPGKRNP
jgi:hypothetical protein